MHVGTEQLLAVPKMRLAKRVGVPVLLVVAGCGLARLVWDGRHPSELAYEHAVELAGSKDTEATDASNAAYRVYKQIQRGIEALRSEHADAKVRKDKAMCVEKLRKELGTR